MILAHRMDDICEKMKAQVTHENLGKTNKNPWTSSMGWGMGRTGMGSTLASLSAIPAGKKQQGSAPHPAGAGRPQTPLVWLTARWTRHTLGSYEKFMRAKVPSSRHR